MPLQTGKHAQYAFESLFRPAILIIASLLVITLLEGPIGIDAFYLEPSRYRIQIFTETALKGIYNNDDGDSAKKPLRKWGKPKNGPSAEPEIPTKRWGRAKSIQRPVQELATEPRQVDDGATSAAPRSYGISMILPDEEEEENRHDPAMYSNEENEALTVPVPSPTISMPTATKISAPATATTTPSSNSTPEYQRIQTLVNTHPLLMFMNGSQANPKDESSDTAAKVLERLCGAGSMSAVGSKQMRNENLFVMMDVTSDDALRQGLEEYHPDWDPAIPQVYINGDCRGGAEQMLKLFNTGEFQNLINQIELKQQQ